MELDKDRPKSSESVTMPTTHSGRRGTTPDRGDPWAILFVENHNLTLDGMKTLVIHTTRSQKRTILPLRQEGNEAETRTRGDSY